MNTSEDDAIAMACGLGVQSLFLRSHRGNYYHSICATSRLGQLVGEVWIPLREEYGLYNCRMLTYRCLARPTRLQCSL
jgi:hypothetical protein